MGTGPIRVFVVDDHDVVREGLRLVIDGDPDLEVVGDAATASAAIAGILELEPDVALVDVRLLDGSGIEVVRHVRSSRPTVRCLMFTSFADETAFLQSVVAGAAGYLTKDASRQVVTSAIHRVAAGESLIDRTMLDDLRGRSDLEPVTDDLLAQLTPHERRILGLITEGHTNREIAQQLHLSEKTIRNYVSNILGKVGMKNRTQLAVHVASLRSSTGSAVGLGQVPPRH